MTLTRRALAATTLTLPLALTAGCGRSPVDSAQAATSRGPIRIWVSNNEQELAWGHAVTEAWNAERPEEPVTLQEVPAGASSERRSPPRSSPAPRPTSSSTPPPPRCPIGSAPAAWWT